MTRRIPESSAAEVGCLFTSVAAELSRFAATLVQGDQAGAEDLVQEVFHDAALNWDKLRQCDLGHQRAWLFRALRNKAITRWNTAKRVNIGLDSAGPSSDPDDTHDKALTSIALDRCWKVLKAMPPGRYRVAYLRWHEDWSSAEIAEHLGIVGSTVRGHLKKARDELDRAVGPDVTFLSDREADRSRREQPPEGYGEEAPS
jgi:RNA polymerase sigma-70 factor (ECF subfamily)